MTSFASKNTVKHVNRTRRGYSPLAFVLTCFYFFRFEETTIKLCAVQTNKNNDNTLYL